MLNKLLTILILRYVVLTTTSNSDKSERDVIVLFKTKLTLDPFYLLVKSYLIDSKSKIGSFVNVDNVMFDKLTSIFSGDDSL